MLVEDDGWRKFALCRNRVLVPDPDIFHGEDFPEELGTELQPGPEWGRVVAEARNRNIERERRAQLICSDCLVREACLQENLHEPQGVWGGTTPEERHRLRAGRTIRTVALKRAPRTSPARDRVVALFQEGLSVEDVALKAGIGRSQVTRYLSDHIAVRQSTDLVKIAIAA